MIVGKVLLLAGLITLIAGIVVVLGAPAIDVWELKSDDLSSSIVVLPNDIGFSEHSPPFNIEKEHFIVAKDFVVKGHAWEENGNKFNFYVMNGANFVNWRENKSYLAYFESENVATVNFSFPLTKEQVFHSGPRFIVENLASTDIHVYISATMEWNEKTTIGNIMLGGAVALIGFIVAISGRVVSEEKGLVGSNATKANTSTIVAIIFFAIFGILAIVIGVVDLMNPIYPWGQKLPILGQIAFMVGILSLVATSLLWKLKRLGGYLGIISFVIAYAVNVYVGEHPLLHAIAGVIAGLVLFIPLAFGWKSLS